MKLEERPTPLTDALPMFAHTNKAGANLTTMRNHARTLERMLAEMAEELEGTKALLSREPTSQCAYATEALARYGEMMKGAGK